MVLLTAKASSRTSSAATLSSWARAVVLEASPAILRSLPSTSIYSAARSSLRVSAELWPGQQGVERSLSVVACVVRHGLDHLNQVVFMSPSTHSGE